MNRIAVLVVAGALAVVGAGCVNDRSGCPGGYADPGDPGCGAPGYATTGDIDVAAHQLLEKMRDHGEFKANYAALTNAVHGLPVLLVADIESPARLPFSSRARLELLRDKLMTSVFESGLFQVYDYGTQGSEKADLELLGSLTAVRESARCNVYRLQLRLQVRSTGKIIWTGAEMFAKCR